MNYQTDINSYKTRIKNQKTKAAMQLSKDEFEGLLVTAGRLMALNEALNEVYFQSERER